MGASLIATGLPGYDSEAKFTANRCRGPRATERNRPWLKKLTNTNHWQEAGEIISTDYCPPDSCFGTDGSAAFTLADSLITVAILTGDITLPDNSLLLQKQVQAIKYLLGNAGAGAG